MLAHRLLQHVLSFSLKGTRLPPGIGVLDPFNGPNADEVRRIVTLFHRKYYSDDRPRTLMLGINPGRLGAGSTGLSFTDTKRCESDLGIPVHGLRTHEPSSDFFYRMIRAAGGPDAFYSRVYVHAVCPLGFVKEPSAGPIHIGPPEGPMHIGRGDPAGERNDAQGPLRETLRRSGARRRPYSRSSLNPGSALRCLGKTAPRSVYFRRMNALRCRTCWSKHVYWVGLGPERTPAPYGPAGSHVMVPIGPNCAVPDLCGYKDRSWGHLICSR